MITMKSQTQTKKITSTLHYEKIQLKELLETHHEEKEDRDDTQNVLHSLMTYLAEKQSTSTEGELI